MKQKTVVFIDSGIGGLSTLATALSTANFNVIYFADNNFAPYGNKTKKQLKNRLKDIVLELINKHHPHCIVLACNTATTSSITHLRRLFPNTCFIGTEPALKLSKKLGFKRPVLAATSQTIQSITCSSVKKIPMKTFATNIELYLTNLSYITYYHILKDIFRLKSSTVKNDCLILGCTHYVLIKDIISRFIKLPIIDGNTGVAKQIALALNEKPHQQNPTRLRIMFKFSAKDAIKHEKYKKILKQILAKAIKLC